MLKCIRMLTFLPLEEIDKMDSAGKVRSLIQQKRFWHYELTKLVHGEEEAEKAQAAAQEHCSVRVQQQTCRQQN